MATFKRGKNGVTKIVRDTYRKKPLLNTAQAKADTWWAIIKRVKERDGYKCRACGTPEKPIKGGYLHVHHIKELSKGGTTSMLNLISLCEKCHQKRHGHNISGHKH